MRWISSIRRLDTRKCEITTPPVRYMGQQRQTEADASNAASPCRSLSWILGISVRKRLYKDRSISVSLQWRGSQKKPDASVGVLPSFRHHPGNPTVTWISAAFYHSLKYITDRKKRKETNCPAGPTIPTHRHKNFPHMKWQTFHMREIFKWKL